MKIINEKYTSLENFSEKFKNSKPFPHIVFDNFLDKSFFSELDTEKFTIEKFKLKQFNNLDHPAKPRWPLDEDAAFLKGAGVRLF